MSVSVFFSGEKAKRISQNVDLHCEMLQVSLVSLCFFRPAQLIWNWPAPIREQLAFPLLRSAQTVDVPVLSTVLGEACPLCVHSVFDPVLSHRHNCIPDRKRERKEKSKVKVLTLCSDTKEAF